MAGGTATALCCGCRQLPALSCCPPPQFLVNKEREPAVLRPGAETTPGRGGGPGGQGAMWRGAGGGEGGSRGLPGSAGAPRGR